jgi:hypothetical protein
MTKVTCDRCGTDITEKKHSVVDGVREPEGFAPHENVGVVTETADVCARCYRAIWKFIGITPRMPRRKRAKVNG